MATIKSLLPLTLAIVFAFLFVADRYRARPIKDFPNLSEFRKANRELKFRPEVIFIGDSIIANWNLQGSFPGKAYLNRGIGWQTTSQVLLRMHQDVVDLHPRTVVIEVGTNDLTGIFGEISMTEMQSNYQGIYEIASSNGIRIFFASILPVHEYSTTAKSRHVFALHPPGEIKTVNQWLRKFSSEHGLTFLDYYAAMVDERGFLGSDLSDDGVHPNVRGYTVMAHVLNESLATSRTIETPLRDVLEKPPQQRISSKEHTPTGKLSAWSMQAIISLKNPIRSQASENQARTCALAGLPHPL